MKQRTPLIVFALVMAAIPFIPGMPPFWIVLLNNIGLAALVAAALDGGLLDARGTFIEPARVETNLARYLVETPAGLALRFYRDAVGFEQQAQIGDSALRGTRRGESEPRSGMVDSLGPHIEGKPAHVLGKMTRSPT